MAHGMLGADLESMAALGSQLDLTTGEIGDVSLDAQRIANTVVEDLTQTFARAIAEVTTAMNAFDSSIQTLVAQTDTTEWTGANRDTFVNAAAQCHTSCGQIREQTQVGWEDFDAHKNALSENLEAFQVALTANLASAEESTQSMSSAVAAQSQALDVTMNTGLTVGP